MAISGKEFWTQFLDILEGGEGSSVPDYYLPHEGEGIDGAHAQEGEWANVIAKTFERTDPGSPERARLIDLLDEAGFFRPSDNLDFWKNEASSENELDVQDLERAAEERFPDLFAPESDNANVGDVTPPTGQETVDGAQVVPGILSGGTLTRIDRDGREPLWGMTYVVNGVQHVYTFDSYEAAEAILGTNPVTSGQYGFLQLTEDTINDGDTWLLGDAGAFAGQSGSYAVWFDDVMEEAALEAGSRNPGRMGDFLSQPEIQRIMAEGEAGGWSDARIQAEIRRTDYYQNVMYPGIEKILATGSSSPEREWAQYYDSVEQSLEMLGYQPDADGTYGSAVGEMLESGIMASEFNSFAPTFVRAEQSQDFAEALDYWTQQELGKALDFEDWFDVLEGTASGDMMDVVEKATLQFQANQTTLGVSDADIARIAANTNLSEAQAAAALSQAEQQLLAVGDENLERFGLSQSLLTGAAFGLESEFGDPLSSDGATMSANEVRMRAQKAATELGIADDRKAQFFVGFNNRGTPVRQGLAAANPERG